jgi:hypothetical protein
MVEWRCNSAHLLRRLQQVSNSRIGCFYPWEWFLCIHSIRDWVGPRAGTNDVTRKIVLCQETKSYPAPNTFSFLNPSPCRHCSLNVMNCVKKWDFKFSRRRVHFTRQHNPEDSSEHVSKNTFHTISFSCQRPNLPERDKLLFWNVAPCSLLETERHFRGAYCLHLHGSSR